MLILSKCIVAIHLHECGRFATFTFVDGKRIVTRIEDICRISQGAYETDIDLSDNRFSPANLEERVAGFQEFERIFGSHIEHYIPILVKGELCVIDTVRAAEILDLGLLDALTSGIPIETEQMKMEEDFIDSDRVVISVKGN